MNTSVVNKAPMDHFKDAVDVVALSTTAATILGMLPHIASALSIIWMVIRLYEWAERRFFKRKEKQNDQQSEP